MNKAFNLQLLSISIIPKSMENYVSLQIGCFRFIDSYRFLQSSLNNLVKVLMNFLLWMQMHFLMHY